MWSSLAGTLSPSRRTAKASTTLLRLQNFSEDSETSEEVASCELAEPTVDSKDEPTNPTEPTSALSGYGKATEQHMLGAHAVSSSKSAHQAATCVRIGQGKLDLDPQCGLLTLKKVSFHDFDTVTHWSNFKMF